VKIALATDWFAPRRGGIETQLVELASRLAARGHEVDVLTTTPGAVGRAGYHVRAIDSVRLPGLDVAVSPLLGGRLHGVLSGRDYDVVHAHVSVVSPVAYAATFAARALGIPVIVSFHSILMLKQWLLALADSVAGLSSDAIVWSGVSELVSSQLRAALPRAHVVTLANATDVAFWRAGSRIPQRPLAFVSTGRMHRKKRPLAVLRAFASARRRFRQPARLILLGEGPERSRVERAVRELDLTTGDSTASVGGWLSRVELRQLYGSSTAFVLASRRESFGIAALEARAAGLPVIAMRVAGSSEFLRHETDSLLCDTDSDMADALVRIANDAELRARLTASGTLVDRYDWAHAVQRHESVYAAAIARAAPKRGVVAASA